MLLDEKRSGDRIPSPDGEGEATGSPPPDPHGLLVWLMMILERYAHREIDDDQLITALRRVGRYAADTQTFPEKLIIALKVAWGQVVPRAGRAAKAMDDRLLARLVTACLDGYYGSKGSASGT